MDALRPVWDAERPGLHSHAERGNDHDREISAESLHASLIRASRWFHDEDEADSIGGIRFVELFELYILMSIYLVARQAYSLRVYKTHFNCHF